MAENVRLINANAEELQSRINRFFKKGTHRFIIKTILKDAPAVDAVPVVRCKDCKHYFYSSFSMGMKCKHDGLEWGKDDFCSSGERKDDGERTEV